MPGDMSVAGYRLYSRPLIFNVMRIGGLDALIPNELYQTAAILIDFIRFMRVYCNDF